MPKMIEQMHDSLDFLNDAIFEYEQALTKAYHDRTLAPSAVLDAWDKARSYLDETSYAQADAMLAERERGE